jgi:competence transcription factor ComK
MFELNQSQKSKIRVGICQFKYFFKLNIWIETKCKFA